ncbi:MAG: Hint domain-containing protein [Pseudomonadota bacterium]
MKCLDFDALAAGTVVTDAFADQGVRISATGGSDQAMIFDTSNPTGGDTDLASSNLGNVLIISEDGDSGDPDDNGRGGTVTFDFDEPAFVNRLTFIDIEGGATVRFFDQDGDLIDTIAVPGTDDNGQRVQDFDVPGVARMEVVLPNSGGLDALVFDSAPVGPETLDDDELDGIVDGTIAADIIDLDYTGDPQGDRIDAGDAILPGEGPDDDIVDARAGDDVVEAGLGEDKVFAGRGDDTVDGESGNDLIFGDARFIRDDDDDDDDDDREVFDWSSVASAGGAVGPGLRVTGGADVNFSIVSEGGASLFSTEAQNLSNVGTADAPVDASSSLVSELSDDGALSVYALDFSIPVSDAAFRLNGIDGDAQVEVRAFDENGDEVPLKFEAGPGLVRLDTDGDGEPDTLASNGSAGDDPTVDNSALVSVPGPVSRIEISHFQDGSEPSSINVTNVFFDAPIVDFGRGGDDSLLGGEGDDTIFGEGGDDTLEAGDGKDFLFGGADRDVLRDLNAGDFADGGSRTTSGNRDDDFDTLDLRGVLSDVPGGSIKTNFTSDDQENGFVQVFDSGGDEIGRIQFREIENIIPCFTPGTRIATPQGERAVEDLRPGDRVITRDNGLQEVRWVGRRDLSLQDLAQAPNLRPILVRAGALGRGLPERDMCVSPQHRVLINTDRTALYFDDSEVLAAARHLTELDGITQCPAGPVSYVHFMCDRHEVVLSDGAWTESFQPGDTVMEAMGQAAQEEIYALFPELRDPVGRENYRAARLSLRRHEARLLSF